MTRVTFFSDKITLRLNQQEINGRCIIDINTYTPNKDEFLHRIGNTRSSIMNAHIQRKQDKKNKGQNELNSVITIQYQLIIIGIQKCVHIILYNII